MFRKTLTTTFAAITLLAATSSLHADTIDPRQEILEASLDAWDIPGISATVIGPEGSIWTETAGTRGEGAPVEPSTLFDTGSITKTFTSALILDLVDRGLIELDDPLGKFVTDFPNSGRITIRHLLNHTSGIPDTFENPQFLPSILSDLDRRWTPEDSFRLLSESQSMPGERFHYANPNYLLLGKVIETVTGEPVEELLEQRILNEYDLEETIFRNGEGAPRMIANPFIDVDSDGSLDDLGKGTMTAFITSAWTAGAVAATSSDLARWGRMFLSGSIHPKPIREELMRKIERDNGWKYGLGIAFREHAGVLLAGHSGNGAGYSAALWHDPLHDVTVAVLTNRHAFNANRIADLLLDASLGRSWSLPRAEAGPEITAAADSEELAPAFFDAAKIQIAEGKHAEAVETLTRVTTLKPDNPEYQRTLGQVALAACQGAAPMDAFRFSQIAVAALNKTIELDPSDLEARLSLMRFFLHAPPIAGGNVEKARQQAEEIGKLDAEMGRRARAEIDATLSS